jgi:hypothetical protein
MKPNVEAAVAELRANYPGRVELEDQRDGGAKVVVTGLSLADSPYVQPDTWCGFTITYTHPYADIYPHFVRGDLSRRDGKPFGRSFHPNTPFYGAKALMLSRRTKLFGTDNPVSALLKLEKVMRWMTSQ